jgi:hypothetical protein
MEGKALKRVAVSAVVLMALVGFLGCESMDKGEKGGLAGAGLGAIIGQAIGHNTAGTLIGAGVGAGLGYIIGNEMDKQDATNRQKASDAETRPFANTAWQVLSITPKPKTPFQSIVSRFYPDGTMVTTKTDMDGKVTTEVESYRVVGNTLIINKPGYVINSRYRMEGNRVYIDTGDHSIVAQLI